MRTNSLKALLTAALAVAALAVAATPALADGPGIWSSQGTSTMKWSGTVTIKYNGGNPKTCTIVNPGTSPWSYTSSNGFEVSNAGFYLSASCTGGTTLQMFAGGGAYYYTATGYEVEIWDPASVLTSPYGNWVQWSHIVPFTNGSGATPSKATYSNTLIGRAVGGNVTMSGTINVTTPAGGLLTLSH